MLQYEVLNIWESIHDLLGEWIETVILEGWDLYRSHVKIISISETLVSRIALALSQDFHINEEQLLNLSDKFQPVIFNWIDVILRIRWDFLRNTSKLSEFKIIMSRDLIKIFLDNVDIIKEGRKY